MDSSSDSDYNVENYIKPDSIRKQINDESADLLGNFDDIKRQQILNGSYLDSDTSVETYEQASSEETSSKLTDDNDHNQYHLEADCVHNELINNKQDCSTGENDVVDTVLSEKQLNQLMRGSSKRDRYVVYVTNLNFETTKRELITHFSTAGEVRSVRIPKNQRGGFAFVEMQNLDGFRKAFALHNTQLLGREIKVQFTEAGKKKSANKKNIMKQKNRKLSEMRNEMKLFTKSGKFYDKALKKEKSSEILSRKKWRKKTKIST